MTTKRGRPENLRRGPQSPEARSMTQARKARADSRQEVEQAEELARVDPEAQLMEFYVDLAGALKTQVQELKRHPKDPSRNLIDGLRELRQTGVQVIEILNSRGNATGPESVFAALEDRLGQANLGEGPTPFVEHPSRPG